MEKSMKKATLIVWVIIFGIIALVIFQNQPFFLAKNALRINFGVFEEYLTPELPNAVLTLIFFFSGLIIAYLFSFSARFKAKRTIKKLNTSITSSNGELDKLRREINTLKGVEPPVDNQADTVKLDMSATQKISDESTIESSKAETPIDKTIKLDAAEETSNPAEDSKEGPEDKTVKL